MLDLFVIDPKSNSQIPVFVSPAKEEDLDSTSQWQTNWTTQYAQGLPNKVALHRTDDHELLGLMSYFIDGGSLAVEIIYVESARHSNANILHIEKEDKKYIGIAKALFAYAADISKASGFGGVLIFKAKTSELVDYYIREFGACHAGSYDPFRLVIWEEEAEQLLQNFWKE